MRPRGDDILARGATDNQNSAYRDFHIVGFVRKSSLLSIESRIWVIPALVQEAIIWEAERIRLVVLRVLRHGTGTSVRWGLQATC